MTKFLLEITISQKLIVLISIFFIVPISIKAQDLDSLETRGPYKYALPILGKKAYEKGYNIPLPHGILAGTFFNKQGLILDNFEMDIADADTDPSDLDFVSLDGILDFGPSEGRINTFNVRVDTWLLPFLNISGIAGRVSGEQTISFSIVGSDLIESVTDIEGQYYGFNLLGIVPLGPVNVALDHSWTWTTNKRLDKPVAVKVGGIRVIKQIKTNTANRYFAVWGGAQSQTLEGQTSGNIAFDEALGITEEDKANLDTHWDNVLNDEVVVKEQPITGNPLYWSDLTPAEQALRQGAFDLVRGVADSNVYYKFNKRLEYDWNMVLGAAYQHNERWGLKIEYGFLKSKRQVMFNIDYRFGI